MNILYILMKQVCRSIYL